MNGQIEQMSNIVISARKALYLNCAIDFVPREYVLSIRFLFAPKFLGLGAVEAVSVGDWFDICNRRGLKDIKFIIPTAVDSYRFLGLSNTSQGLIVCFWKNGKVSCFSPWWEVDFKREGWNVVYRETVGINLEKEETVFVDRAEEFKGVLSDIGRFSTDLGFPFFSDRFQKARDALCDSTLVESDGVPKNLPDKFKGIYYAIDISDVFGAMGSWNDSPSWYAHEKGLYKEYNELSGRLLQQIRYSLMHVVNECWR